VDDENFVALLGERGDLPARARTTASSSSKAPASLITVFIGVRSAPRCLT